MAKNEETPTTGDISQLFERATVDPDMVASVSKYVRTGRRWDLTHKELVDDLVVILSAREVSTKYGPAMLCNIEHNGEKKVALMGGQVLIDQIKDIGVNLPVLAVIRKPARSYGLFDPTPEMVAEYKEAYLSPKPKKS